MQRALIINAPALDWTSQTAREDRAQRAHALAGQRARLVASTRTKQTASLAINVALASSALLAVVTVFAFIL